LVLSRDDIRIELGYCGDGEKYLGNKEEEQKVSELFNKRFEEGIKNGRIIVLNNLNLKKKYREESVRLLRKNGYVVKFVYVEAPTLEHNYERRKNDMNKEVIDNMILSFDFPEPNEYDELYIKKERCLID
jgi:predicted kinase